MTPNISVSEAGESKGLLMEAMRNLTETGQSLRQHGEVHHVGCQCLRHSCIGMKLSTSSLHNVNCSCYSYGSRVS